MFIATTFKTATFALIIAATGLSPLRSPRGTASTSSNTAGTTASAVASPAMASA